MIGRRGEVTATVESQSLSFTMISDVFNSAHTQRLRGQTSLAEEIVGTQNCDHGFFALLGDDGDLGFALLNVKNRIRRLALLVKQFDYCGTRIWIVPRLLSVETLWDRMAAFWGLHNGLSR